MIPAALVVERRYCGHGHSDAAYHEAAELVRMIDRGAMTVEQARELIAIPPRLRAALEAYAETLPAVNLGHYFGARADDRGLGFSVHDLDYRDAVARHFERLVDGRSNRVQ